MMKSEFEELIGKAVSNDDYRVIEFVYMYHPVIDPVSGKKQIAEMWKIGGMGLIADMVKTAKVAEQLDRRMRELRHEMDTIRYQMDALKRGVNARKELDKKEEA